MNKIVIIILDKDISSTDLFIEKLENWFPSNYYSIDIYTRENFRHRDINYIWMVERLPIVIGYGYGGVYLEQVKNYSIKFLISPFWNENLLGSIFNNIDEYDKENTYCLFGDNPKSLEMAEIYAEHYPNTLNDLSKGELSLIDAIEICGMINIFLKKGEKEAKNRL